MAEMSPLVRRERTDLPGVVIRKQEEWGLWTADVVAAPWRLTARDGMPPPVLTQGVDLRRLENVSTPADIFCSLPQNDNWSAQSRRTLAKLSAFFLVGEDPQRRLDAREVSTLAHQVSLVRHVLDNDGLRRVLIADEVGLGKTVEIGLILKELFEKSPTLRVLYLAPARLVGNVRREFDRMNLGFRQWSATGADARLSDNRLLASIHRAVHPRHSSSIIATEPWDVIVVDECHHLSDWAPGGGDPRERFRLVRDLVQRQGNNGRVMLLSGTPHQGHVSRFDNLLGLLKTKSESISALSGRVIYRTKDDVRDWDGHLLFPRREVKAPIVVDLGSEYKQWISDIHQFYAPEEINADGQTSRRRAAGWRCAQALQWAASSPQAGVGYLVRQAIRAGKTLRDSVMRDCVAALRPYRGGSLQESIEQLFERMRLEVQRQLDDVDLDDLEYDEGVELEQGDELTELLSQGLGILRRSADVKWQIIKERILDERGDEKVVLFAQPIETVTAFAHYLERVTGRRPALIMGGQSDTERTLEVEAFHRPNGPQFLVSSRAGGRGSIFKSRDISCILMCHGIRWTWNNVSGVCIDLALDERL